MFNIKFVYGAHISLWIHKKPNTVFQTQGLYIYPCASS